MNQARRSSIRQPKSLAAMLIALVLALVAAFFQRPTSSPTEPAGKKSKPSQSKPSSEPTREPSPIPPPAGPHVTTSRREDSSSTGEKDFETIKGVVAYVKDGDSLVLREGTSDREVRLWGIDAPEGNTHQPFAQEARDYSRQLCQKKKVTLLVHDRDQYGRIVAEAILPDGSSLNEKMIEAGWAWHYKRHSPDQDSFARAEREARQAGRGLWQDADPVPPWEWRREHRPDHPNERGDR